MKQIKFFLKIFTFILLVEIITNLLFPEWTFRYRKLVYINIILQSVSFFGVTICLLSLIIKNKTALVILSLFLVLICYIGCYITLFPIDTYGESIDIKCLKINQNTKTIVTQKISGKTGHVKFDTITVRDIWVFRKIYKKSI